ncbi:MAG: hypothetical protein EBS04_01655 [Chitinophagia bacterium]|nr:hypothetical protein [Chitinophagia bacterium]
MRIFIQLDDVYVSNLSILEPILLDLLGMSIAEHSIYLVSTLPKPTEIKGAEWVHPDATKQLIAASSSNILIHFSPVALWAKQLPSYFIPLTLPHLTGHLSWLKSLIEKKRFNKTMQAAKKVLALDEWHAQNRPGVERLYLENAPLPSFEWSQLAPVRSALTDGNQYLLAFVNTQDMIPIVKAFSVFKKWQLSTMSLVFVLDSEAEKDKAANLLLGYKYRDAVELVVIANFTLEWIAAAYLTIFSAMNSHRFQFLTYTMRYQIPFLMHQENPDHPFICSEMAKAGEYFDFKQPDLLANHFKLYYKDEMYRAAKGIEIHKAIQSEISQFQQKATIVWPRDLV